MNIRYYISGHGLGHASRSCQIINCLRRRSPHIRVEVVSDAHPWFFRSFLDPSVPVTALRVDIGVLQQDSLVMDEGLTLAAYRRLRAECVPLIEEQAQSLRRSGIDLVAADIPAMAFAAAHRAGVPSVGISNFTWDWIYEPIVERYPGHGDVLESLRQDYRLAERLLALPFSADFPSIDRIEPLPLVARKAKLPPEEVRRQLDIPASARLALISFGGFGLGTFDFSALSGLRDWVFITETGLGPEIPNTRVLAPGTLDYPSLVGAAHVVITKPGYGIVSECIAAQTAVLYTSRGDFREQALLVEGLKRHTRCLEIDNESLRAGRWGEHLEALMALVPPGQSLATNGDEIAADRLAELCGEGC